MASTLAPPGPAVTSRPTRPSVNSVTDRPVPLSLAVFLLLVGLAHFAVVPGAVFGGIRYGWDGTFSMGSLPLAVTWFAGCLMIVYTVSLYVRASLRPLGLSLGPHDWMRPAVKGAVAS